MIPVLPALRLRSPQSQRAEGVTVTGKARSEAPRRPVMENPMKLSEICTSLQLLSWIQTPAFLWGAPGVGKSQLVAQVAASLGAHLIDIRAIRLDPVDLRSLPTVKNGKAAWATAAFLPADGAGILFLDERNAAPPLVQAACYQLVLDRARELGREEREHRIEGDPWSRSHEQPERLRFASQVLREVLQSRLGFFVERSWFLDRDTRRHSTARVDVAALVSITARRCQLLFKLRLGLLIRQSESQPSSQLEWPLGSSHAALRWCSRALRLEHGVRPCWAATGARFGAAAGRLSCTGAFAAAPAGRPDGPAGAADVMGLLGLLARAMVPSPVRLRSLPASQDPVGAEAHIQAGLSCQKHRGHAHHAQQGEEWIVRGQLTRRVEVSGHCVGRCHHPPRLDDLDSAGLEPVRGSG